MIVKTGLTKRNELAILQSVIGQMSDGIWENSPSVERYWRNMKIERDKDTGEIIINVASWLFMTEADCLKYMAQKIKQIVKKEKEWSNNKIEWNRLCSEELDYFRDGPMVGSVYYVYDRLLGRNTKKFIYS